jgi:hypothetical protein
MSEISDFITSKVRIKILKLFLSDVKEMYHVRGVVRKVREEINAVRRELDRFEKAGFLKKENRGNRVYYWPRKDYKYYGDLLSIVAKSEGIGNQIIENKSKLGKINFVMFSGSFVRRTQRKKDDQVDVLVVGDIVLPELAKIIRSEEVKRATEINYTVMSRDEYDFRKKRRDPFLLGILSGSRTMIIGDEEDLVG